MKELEFLQIIKNTLSQNAHIGDDCAWLKDLGIVITQDSLVEDIHFSLKFATPYQLAYKAIIVNLSDILASGAKPKYLTISLSIPNHLDNSFIKEFYKACNDLSEEFGFEIVGGDITGSPKLFISICAIGTTNGRNISSRKNAKVGDLVVTTGVHGSSTAGLSLLREKERGKREEKEDAKMQSCKDAECICEKPCLQDDEAIQEYPSPEFLELVPRSEIHPSPSRGEDTERSSYVHRSPFTVHHSLLKAHLMPALAKDFSREIATKIKRDYAMMDTSDGLVDALFKIAQSSDVLITVDFDKVPYDKGIEKLAQAANIDFKDWIFYGGEDYQLVACVDKENLQNITAPYTIIGEVKEKEAENFVEVVYDDHIQKITDLEKTFNHFKE